MHDYSYDNIVIRFWTQGGVILSRERRSEPVAYEIEDEYWIRTPDGLELELVFNNPDFRYRPGDEVTVVYAGTRSGKESIPTLVHNHSISQSATLASAEWLFGQLIHPASRGMMLLLCLILTVVTTWVSGAWGLSSGLIVYLLARVEEARRKNRMIIGLKAHLESLRAQFHRADERFDVDGALARNP
ncbi:hypothetical protein [Pseudomonas sp. NPDC099000]|uniref:hypothetical protein n=1 Tax=Pseudomonas sp. NPDC099000 TaxID=3364488 RepID=UPI00383A3E4F